LRSFDSEPETGPFSGDLSRLVRLSLWAISVVRFGTGPTTTCGRHDRNPTPNELKGGEWPSCPCSVNKTGAADAGSIPAASTTNYPESLMFSDHRNGATQSRLKAQRAPRAQKPRNQDLCGQYESGTSSGRLSSLWHCAFSESVRPEINELFLRSTRSINEQKSVGKSSMIPRRTDIENRQLPGRSRALANPVIPAAQVG